MPNFTIDDNIGGKWYNLSDGERRLTYTVPNKFEMKKEDLYGILLQEYGGNMKLERETPFWKSVSDELERLEIIFNKYEPFVFSAI